MNDLDNGFLNLIHITCSVNRTGTKTDHQSDALWKGSSTTLGFFVQLSSQPRESLALAVSGVNSSSLGVYISKFSDGFDFVTARTRFVNMTRFEDFPKSTYFRNSRSRTHSEIFRIWFL